MRTKDNYPEGTGRRGFLARLIGFLLFTLFLGSLKVIASYLIPPARAKKSEKVTISTAQLQTGSNLVMAYDDNPIILIHDVKGIRVFSAVCTHLGCIVKWVPEKSIFLCPCHAGKFDDSTGVVLGGPPPEPLPKIPFKLEEDKIVLA